MIEKISYHPNTITNKQVTHEEKNYKDDNFYWFVNVFVQKIEGELRHKK